MHLYFSVASTVPMPTLVKKSSFELFLLGSPHHVVDTFFRSWSPDLILRLKPLNSSMYFAVEAYMFRAWSIHEALSPWFFEPEKFLRTLHECDGIVSGSAALLFLGREGFTPSDLDIYVPLHGLLNMGRFLKAESFRYQATGPMHPLFDVAALSLSSAMGKYVSGPSQRRRSPIAPFTTFNFYRPGSGLPLEGREGTHVQVSVTYQDPIMFMIETFHSSERSRMRFVSSIVDRFSAAVMNYFTSTYAASLFPFTTFNERRSLVCQDIRQSALIHRSWMDKYRRRGFEIVTAESPFHPTFETRYWNREVGDDLTWVLPLRRGSTCSYSRYGASLTLDAGMTDRNRSPVQVKALKFEALAGHYRVCAAGAAMRTGPPFKYRYECVGLVQFIYEYSRR